jgi:hypothetical protein
VGKGVVDWRLERPEGVDPAALPSIVSEMGPRGLQASWTRVYARWKRLQPTAPGVTALGDADGDGYDDSYVAELDAVIDALHAQGINVIITGIDVPEWASDKRYWVGDYDPDVVMRIDAPLVRGAFRDFAKFLGRHFAGRANHFEVWNEPNLGSGIYPQIVGKKVVGPAVYFKMLKAFYRGAKQGNRNSVVIAGATSRRGANEAHSTSPQWFAKYLKVHGASKWFNAYSHHPYTPPGSRPAPNMPPRNPKNMVTLGNIDVLLKLFPRTPFYLTEYGYSTGTSDLFCVTVSPADQARYMRQAYARMARRQQVKALLWFLVVDYCPNSAQPANGIYSGLVGTDATRKPGWYAFAGHNQLTATTPWSSSAAAPFSVHGALTTKLGPSVGETVTLQSRGLSSSRWTKVATMATQAGGAYSFTVRQNRSKVYRVVWDGVCESPKALVRAQ